MSRRIAEVGLGEAREELPQALGIRKACAERVVVEKDRGGGRGTTRFASGPNVREQTRLGEEGVGTEEDDQT